MIRPCLFAPSSHRMTVKLQASGNDLIHSFIQVLSSEVIPVNVGEEEQVVFREALRRYFDSLPLHGISASSDKAKIERVIEFPSFRCRVTTFRETRCLVRCVVPYKGWKVPQLRRSEINTEAWEFSWAPGISPSEGFEVKIIADSQEVQPCSKCTAVGTLECGTCNCSGQIGCLRCESAGIVNCPTCEGQRKLLREKQVQKFRPCGSCGTNALMNVLAVFDNNPYTNVRRCAKCNGTGEERFVLKCHFRLPFDTCKFNRMQNVRARLIEAFDVVDLSVCRVRVARNPAKCRTAFQLSRGGNAVPIWSSMTPFLRPIRCTLDCFRVGCW